MYKPLVNTNFCLFLQKALFCDNFCKFLLTALYDFALSGKIIECVACADVRYFLALYADTALLYGTARIGTAVTQTCLDENCHNIHIACGEILSGYFDGRHMLGSACSRE